jgi:biotin operon repressor
MNCNLKSDILYFIPKYPDKISGRELADVTGLRGSEQVRMQVNALRTAGYPIVSTSQGYSIATNSEQIEKCIQSLRSRCSAIEEAICGLYKSFGSIAQ